MDEGEANGTRRNGLTGAQMEMAAATFSIRSRGVVSGRCGIYTVYMAKDSAGEYVATVFMNGGSQAVRLPKECRMAGTKVRVRKVGTSVILEPLRKPKWPRGFWDRLASLPPMADDMTAPEAPPDRPDRDAELDD
jgi:antitoxin VapB